MNRISLHDVDRPSEPFEVELVGLDGAQRTLHLSVPLTTVRFSLYRRDHTRRFEGSLGGRSYYYDVPEKRAELARATPVRPTPTRVTEPAPKKIGQG